MSRTEEEVCNVSSCLMIWVIFNDLGSDFWRTRSSTRMSGILIILLPRLPYSQKLISFCMFTVLKNLLRFRRKSSSLFNLLEKLCFLRKWTIEMFNLVILVGLALQHLLFGLALRTDSSACQLSNVEWQNSESERGWKTWILKTWKCTKCGECD